MNCICGVSVEATWNYCPHCGQHLTHAIKAWKCPRCETVFEDDGKEHPHGILCPECRKAGGGMVGVLQPCLIEPTEGGDDVAM